MLPFSAPFRIDNTGYVSFRAEQIFFYIHSLKAGPITMRRYTDSRPQWNHKTLDRAEGETIVCNALATRAPPEEADIAIIVEYKPWGFPGTFRQYFRFERFEGPYMGTWQWVKQPVSEIKGEIDQQIEQFKQNFKQNNAQ